MQKYSGLFFVLMLLLNGCKPKDGGDKFDRAAMLTNLGNNVIIPAHQNMQVLAITLKQKKDAFVVNPSSTSLDSLKVAFKAAYLAYQAVETYSFTPSANVRYLNVFATDTNQINNNIATGSYDLTAANNIKAKGFPAIDYLLFSRSQSEILNLFTALPLATNRKQYLNDITNDIESIANEAATGWSNYLSQFISAAGTDVGSSVGMLVNDLSFESEKCRRERVGNALGYVGPVSSGSLAPETLEGYFSATSKELLVKNLQSLKLVYEGGTGSGFDDYLTYLNADYNGQPLATALSAQFDLVLQKAQAVPVDYATAVTTNRPDMESLFLELKKLTVMLKVDMSSQLGVIINYTDNDGD
jgi:predicted lipoprotein